MSRRKLDVDRTRERLLGLGLAHAADQLEPLLSEAVKEGHAPHALIDALLDAEHQAREGRRVRTALRLSSLPNGQTLADFSSQRSSARASIPWPGAPTSARPRPS